jgi:hypothetical protein
MTAVPDEATAIHAVPVQWLKRGSPRVPLDPGHV